MATTTTTTVAEETDPARDDARWRAVLARDRRCDGAFWYSVRSTGVFCRPSCSSRPARRDRVAFHDSPDAARDAGFRPCRRCHPDGLSVADAQTVLVERACRLIDAAGRPPSLAALADAVELSPAHFSRVFRRVTGLTPRGYAAARRAAAMRERLGAGAAVTTALHDAGFGASSRFYAAAPAITGMAPRRFRDGGRHEEIRLAPGRCTLGAIVVAASARGVVAIELGDDPDVLLATVRRRFGRARIDHEDPDFARLVADVIAAVDRPAGDGFDQLPLDIRGTAFQARVWDALRRIPPGATASYGAVAAAIGAPAATRAVAGACAANTLAVAIPCHRAVRGDGTPSGYRWGAARKRQLLAREQT